MSDTEKSDQVSAVWSGPPWCGTQERVGSIEATDVIMTDNRLDMRTMPTDSGNVYGYCIMLSTLIVSQLGNNF